MNVLPRISFLFQIIPVKIEDKVLNKWQKQITEIIYSNKKPRNKLNIFQDKVD